MWPAGVGEAQAHRARLLAVVDVERLHAQTLAELGRDARRQVHDPEVEPREDHPHALLALLGAVEWDAAELGERVQAEHVVVVVVSEHDLLRHRPRAA